MTLIEQYRAEIKRLADEISDVEALKRMYTIGYINSQKNSQGVRE